MKSEEIFLFVRECINSIRELNRRKDELRWIMKQEECSEDLKGKIRERYKSLQETKFCLIYSMYDVRSQSTQVLGQEQYEKVLGTIKLYEELKDL